MANIKDVADFVGVSKSTVSNVFNNKKNVSEEIRNKVLDAAKQLNYYPNKLAVGLSKSKTGFVGIFIDNSSHFRNMDFKLIEGASTELLKSSQNLILYLKSGNDSINYKESLNRELATEPIDGAIIIAPMVRDIRISDLSDMKKPIVLIGRAPKIFENIRYVDVDNVDIAYEVTKTLLDKGHRNIAMINSDSNLTISIDRLKGYIKAMNEYNLEFKPENIYNAENTSDAGKRLADLVFDNLEVTAIITSSDEVACGVYQAAERRKISIPKDLSVFALGGTDRFLRPNISTVHVDYKLLGTEAVKLLTGVGSKEGRKSCIIDRFDLIETNSIRSI